MHLASSDNKPELKQNKYMHISCPRLVLPPYQGLGSFHMCSSTQDNHPTRFISHSAFSYLLVWLCFSCLLKSSCKNSAKSSGLCVNGRKRRKHNYSSSLLSLFLSPLTRKLSSYINLHRTHILDKMCVIQPSFKNTRWETRR